jgi:hypothetical protein
MNRWRRRAAYRNKNLKETKESKKRQKINVAMVAWWCWKWKSPKKGSLKQPGSRELETSNSLMGTLPEIPSHFVLLYFGLHFGSVIFIRSHCILHIFDTIRRNIGSKNRKFRTRKYLTAVYRESAKLTNLICFRSSADFPISVWQCRLFAEIKLRDLETSKRWYQSEKPSHSSCK